MRGWGPRRPTSVDTDGDDGGVESAQQQIQTMMWRNQKLIAPDARPKKRWDKLLLLFTMYSALEMPLLWAFSVVPHAAHLVRSAAARAHT